MKPYTRPELDSLPAYVPGKSVPGAIKLASNETTAGPLPSVAKAIAEAVETANRYPDNGWVELSRSLGEHLDVSTDQIAAGCGSVSLIQQLMQATCNAGDEVVFAWRSFEVYPVTTQAVGAVPVQVPLTADHRHDLDAMADAVTDRTRLIIICNPNNPTGTAVGRAEIEAFLDRVPDHIAVALDEAYFEYMRPGDQLDEIPDGVEIARSHPNVVVLRTFSKAYGLAGVRVGYAVGDPSVIKAMRVVYVPFSVSSLAQAAAVACLDAQHELLDRTDAVVAERARVRDALIAAGYEVPSSEANFVWLPLGEETQDFSARSTEAGVLLRPYAADGVRVTIGDPHENDAFLAFATTDRAAHQG
ncbi:histidinol-phosphate transaminase [Rhodococcus sp. D2-41]|uniref:Aromatic amino acid aminotransferase n=1 Tax=Speluncibacter jeojiensis TaxID=2710754 RepID=A0A9X4RDG8_9ACTN|nr:histidinol-phosphate transaminase [Rhodococcus sp. D2-41]MDG3010405.1 histidinol-phosphate transaminase [Rhodococcus sp. D2-41]MDG3014152.1 histidinol-phosphate transaminase [Corynebacteriales bacterium D3-21]